MYFSKQKCKLESNKTCVFLNKIVSWIDITSSNHHIFYYQIYIWKSILIVSGTLFIARWVWVKDEHTHTWRPGMDGGRGLYGLHFDSQHVFVRKYIQILWYPWGHLMSSAYNSQYPPPFLIPWDLAR